MFNLLYFPYISTFLARLRMSYRDHSPSVVCPFTPLNELSSETPWPIFFKFHVEHSVKRGLKIYTNGHGLKHKDGRMPKYGKNTKTLLLQNKESFEDESRYLALGIQGPPSLFK